LSGYTDYGNHLIFVKAHNWKPPGNNKIQNYGLKILPAAQWHIVENVNAIVGE